MKIGKIIIAGSCILLAGATLCIGIFEMNKNQNRYKLENNAQGNYTSTLFGDNTYIFSPEDDPKQVNKVLEELWNRQETAQFGEDRYAVYFMPGDYDESITVKVGFYMQVAGLGELPQDTRLTSLNCDARWLGDDENNHNACCNFWRGVENLQINSNTMWAVSQATFMRRVDINGALYLHDNYGWCSGGFLADSRVELMIDSGSQQQWLSRNNQFKVWMDDNWNLVFLGDEPGCDPTSTWPAKAYTSVAVTPKIQEKPFLIYDEEQGFMVFVPEYRQEATGISWGNENQGEKLSLDTFYIAMPQEDTAQSLNQALKEGKNILFTPGIYKLEEALQVTGENTILLGTGLATLEASNKNVCIETADKDGIKIAGLLFDAGPEESDNLLVIGEQGAKEEHSQNPIGLSDLFFRVGGASSQYPAKTKNCVLINSSQVIGDNLWIWRADHGDNVAWDKNTADNGLIVNGNDVIMYALMVEHFKNIRPYGMVITEKLLCTRVKCPMMFQIRRHGRAMRETETDMLPFM